MTDHSDPKAARHDRLQILHRIVDRLLGDESHMDEVGQAALNTSRGSAAKPKREQAEDLHSAIVAAGDPELACKWERALSSWCERQTGFPDLKIVGWALEANRARETPDPKPKPGDVDAPKKGD